jgi:cytochrome c peroxidase
MPAGRSSPSDVGLAAALILLFAASCQEPRRSEAAASSAPSAPASSAPAEHFGAEAARRARRAALDLAAQKTRGPKDPAYLELRRALAAGAGTWRRAAAKWTELLLGPERSAREAGGASLLLDGALEEGDAAAAAEQLELIARGSRLLEHELAGARPRLEAQCSALSEAAYELGSIALEASAGVPAGGEAVLADLRGTLDAVERGVAQLPRADETDDVTAAIERETRALGARLDRLTTSLALGDRAGFVRATGRLGALARRRCAALGAQTKLPYRARIPVAGNGPEEPVSALTLPAPRLPAPGAAAAGPGLSALGEQLFCDKRLSRDRVRSCASCHDPARGFADGQATPRSLDPEVRLRHTPTLLYAPLHAAQMWDGRTLTPERQALSVIHARAEMGLTKQELVEALAGVPAYARAFEAEAGGLSPEAVARALVAFEVERLVPASAPVDRFARGDDGALSPDERAGLDVFAGKGRCARCHVPPFFGGSRPRDFAVAVYAAIGVPSRPGEKTIDPDRGRALVTRLAADEHAFKTPTVRNAAVTAPYFHHGAFARLEDVVDFYDKGGGRGLGVTIANQDPDVRPLKLTVDEVRALLAFLRTGLRDDAAGPPVCNRRGG